MGWHVVFMIATCFNLLAAALGLFVLKPMRVRHFAATRAEWKAAPLPPAALQCSMRRETDCAPRVLRAAPLLSGRPPWGDVMTPASPSSATTPASTTADNTLQPYKPRRPP